MYTSNYSKLDHICRFNDAQNRMLMNYERDELEQAPERVLFDAIGTPVNEEASIELITRLIDMEGELMTLRAMKNLGVKENVFYYTDNPVAVLSANEAALCEFAYLLGKHISNEFYTVFLRKSQLARELIGNIIRIGNDALKDPGYDLHTVFEESVMANSSWNNQKNFKTFFGL